MNHRRNVHRENGKFKQFKTLILTSIINLKRLKNFSTYFDIKIKKSALKKSCDKKNIF